MSIRSFLARWMTRAASVAALAWIGASASAADVTAPAPAVVAAAPVVMGADTGCATCQGNGAVGGCKTCGKLHIGKSLFGKTPNPYPVTLCPGACFGYFQTQWRKWDEVCPYPYLGTGVSDAPKPPVGVVNTRPTGSELTPPRPLDPKMTDPKTPDPKKAGGAFPTIPMVPGK